MLLLARAANDAAEPWGFSNFCIVAHPCAGQKKSETFMRRLRGGAEELRQPAEGMFDPRESPSCAKTREVRTLEGNCRCIICVMPGRAFEKTSMLPRFRI